MCFRPVLLRSFTSSPSRKIRMLLTHSGFSRRFCHQRVIPAQKDKKTENKKAKIPKKVTPALFSLVLSSPLQLDPSYHSPEQVPFRCCFVTSSLSSKTVGDRNLLTLHFGAFVVTRRRKWKKKRRKRGFILTRWKPGLYPFLFSSLRKSFGLARAN